MNFQPPLVFWQLLSHPQLTHFLRNIDGVKMEDFLAVMLFLLVGLGNPTSRLASTTEPALAGQKPVDSPENALLGPSKLTVFM